MSESLTYAIYAVAMLSGGYVIGGVAGRNGYSLGEYGAAFTAWASLVALVVFA